MSTTTLERPLVKPELREIPRIYADGKNDDMPGLVAAFKNESVEYDGDVIKSGEEVCVDHRHIRLSARIIVRCPDGEDMDYIGELKEGPFVVVNVPTGKIGRQVTIANSTIEGLDTPDWTWGTLDQPDYP